MGHIPPEGAHLIGSLMGAALYGLYFYLTIHVLIHVKQGWIRSRLITGILTMIWILTTIATATKLSTIYDAFITTGVSSGVFFENEYGRGYKIAFRYVAYFNGFFAQCIMCWRLYVLWNRNRKVLIIPAVLLTNAVVSIYVNLFYVIKSRAAPQPYSEIARRWQFSVLISMLTSNIIITILICWKIWRVVGDVSSFDTGSYRMYRHLIHVMIESGILYTISLVSCFVIKVIKLETAIIILANIMPSVTGILPTLVILRLFSSPQKSERTTKDWSVHSDLAHPPKEVTSYMDSSLENGITPANTPLDDQSKDGSVITRVPTSDGPDRLHEDIRLNLADDELHGASGSKPY